MLNYRYALNITLAIFYAAAGTMHVYLPDPFLSITPLWVPWPQTVIFVTGLCELAGAAGLLIPRFRTSAGCMLGLYALCVVPANIKHAFYNIDVPGVPSSWWYHGPRLMLQPILIWAALYAGHVTDWPFHRSPRSGNG